MLGGSGEPGCMPRDELPMYEEATGNACPYVEISGIESRAVQFVHVSRAWEGVAPMVDEAYREGTDGLDVAGRWVFHRLATHYLSELRKIERAEHEARMAATTGGGEGKPT